MEKWTPEQLNNQKGRVESDAKLIKEGAEFVNDENADQIRLSASDKSIEKAQAEMQKEHLRKAIFENLDKKYSNNPEEKKRQEELVNTILSLDFKNTESIVVQSAYEDAPNDFFWSNISEEGIIRLLARSEKDYFKPSDTERFLELSEILDAYRNRNRGGVATLSVSKEKSIEFNGKYHTAPGF